MSAFTPALVTDFEIQRAGQAFGSHGIQLDAEALFHFELVFAAVIARLAVAAGEIAVLAVIRADDPLTFGLEVDGVGRAQSPDQHGGRHSKRHDFFHDFPPLKSMIIKRPAKP